MSDRRDREVSPKSTTSSVDGNSFTIEEAYEIPQNSGLPYAFTRIDAVYIWTQGGYQVGRDPTDYPLFVAVHEDDVRAWQTFFESVGLPTVFQRRPSDEIGSRIYVVLESRSGLNVVFVDGYPVIPLAETVAYMRDNSPHFQPAISMLKEMYPEEPSME